jgi:photosystem II stability/assembly factor-like uncharacterized protein
VYRSDDAGRIWSEASAGLPARDFGQLFIDPFDTATIYFTADVPGLFKSVDRGGHWRALTGGLTTSISDLVFDPSRRNVLYAATKDGVFTSRDGGRSWQPKSTGLGSNIVTTLAIAPTTPSTLYAGTFRGVYKSTNAGRTWALASSGVLATAIVPAIAIDPSDPSRVFAAAAYVGFDSVFRTEDGGMNWVGVGPGAGIQVTFLTVARDVPETIYATAPSSGSEQGPGVLVTSDRGTTWTTLNEGLTNLNVSQIAVDPTGSWLHAATFYGGEWDYHAS